MGLIIHLQSRVGADIPRYRRDTECRRCRSVRRRPAPGFKCPHRWKLLNCETYGFGSTCEATIDERLAFAVLLSLHEQLGRCVVVELHDRYHAPDARSVIGREQVDSLWRPAHVARLRF